MEKKNSEPKVIDLAKIGQLLWGQKKRFLKVWVWTFVLSCIWILPQPRYYITDVKLAPEMNGEEPGGGLSSIASSFGLSLSSMGGGDAIYPELYPDLFESPEFIVGLYGIEVTTKDGSLTTNYFTYMKEHQKKNYLTYPYYWTMKRVKSFFEDDDQIPRATDVGDINPFQMNRKDYKLMQLVMANVTCTVDKKTSVISIKVKDQDPLICATMTDKVKEHLQEFIIRYRTSKVHEDVVHYQHMRDSAEAEYDKAMKVYSRFCDSHTNIILQSFQSERDKLESDMFLRQNSLTAMENQLQSARVRLQEKTPAFTTLKSVTVPVKPAGPKRMIFVAAMLFLSTIVTSVVICRKYLMTFL